MTDISVVQILREALLMTLIVSAPFMAVGLIVGLIVSIFQTTTSIQEQTLTFVPKIVAIFAAIIFFSSWMIEMMVNYTRNVFITISKIGGTGL
jgi:flagellar biosynthesis protein FliQ